jgi:hypothetical protein
MRYDSMKLSMMPLKNVSKLIYVDSISSKSRYFRP